MSTKPQSRLFAIVEGRVQGVGFRYFVAEEAAKQNATGWVRNRRNRTVEVMAEGDRPHLENLLAALQNGPPAAHVIHVKHNWEEATGEFRNFRIKWIT